MNNEAIGDSLVSGGEPVWEAAISVTDDVDVFPRLMGLNST